MSLLADGAEESDYFGNTTDPPAPTTSNQPAPTTSNRPANNAVSKEAEFVNLCVNSMTCHRRFQKSRKQEILASAVRLEDEELFLGQPIPERIRTMRDHWREKVSSKKQ